MSWIAALWLMQTPFCDTTCVVDRAAAATEANAEESASAIPPYDDPFNDRLPAEDQWTGDESGPEVYEKTLIRADICLYAAARQFARMSDEPTETLISASFGACSEWFANLRIAMTMVEASLSQENLDKVIASYRSNRRERLAAFILEERQPN